MLPITLLRHSSSLFIVKFSRNMKQTWTIEARNNIQSRRKNITRQYLRNYSIAWVEMGPFLDFFAQLWLLIYRSSKKAKLTIVDLIVIISRLQRMKNFRASSCLISDLYTFTSYIVCQRTLSLTFEITNC